MGIPHSSFLIRRDVSPQEVTSYRIETGPTVEQTQKLGFAPLNPVAPMLLCLLAESGGIVRVGQKEVRCSVNMSASSSSSFVS